MLASGASSPSNSTLFLFNTLFRKIPSDPLARLGSGKGERYFGCVGKATAEGKTQDLDPAFRRQVLLHGCSEQDYVLDCTYFSAGSRQEEPTGVSRVCNK